MTHGYEQQVRKGRHCVSALHAHLVFVTKYRGEVFDDDMLKRLEQIRRNICLNGEVKLTEFNSENNHLHLLIKYLLKVQFSQLINALKGVSSRLMRKEYPERHRYLWNGAL